MSRGVICLAAAALVLAASGPSFSQPSSPSSDDPLRWDANQTAQFNATFAKTTHDACLTSAQNHGVPEISIPRRVLLVDSIPLLATGKTDYVTVQKQAAAEAAGAN